MNIILGLIGIAFGFVLVKYRERVGDMLGEPAWATKIGGIYNVIIIIAALIFFWSIAYITGTQDILFAPIINLFPNSQRGVEGGVPFDQF